MALVVTLASGVAHAHDPVDLDSMLRIERPAMVGLGLLEAGIGGGLAAGHLALAVDLGRAELRSPSAAAELAITQDGRSHQFQALMNTARAGVFVLVTPWSGRVEDYGSLLVVTGAEYSVMGGFDLLVGAEALIAGLVAARRFESGGGWRETERQLLSRSALLHLGTGAGLLLAGGVELVFGLTRRRQAVEGNLPLAVAPMGAGALIAGRF